MGRNRALSRGVVIEVSVSKSGRGKMWRYDDSRSSGSAGSRVSDGRSRYVLMAARSSGWSERVSIVDV